MTFGSRAIASASSIASTVSVFGISDVSAKRSKICSAEEKSALHIHFTMRDNPALTEKEISNAERLYTGVFYERYILGRWVLAEGLVYPQFDKALHVVPDTIPAAYMGI